MFTTAKWVSDFIDQLTAADIEHFEAAAAGGPDPQPPTPTRTTEHTTAKRRLQEAGLV